MPGADDTDSKVGADALLALTGTDRKAKAYAFLYAAFRSTEVSANPVRDAVDCLAPFISTYINTVAGKRVTADGVQSYLQLTFGFDIPLYAIEQLLPSLQRLGMVDYSKPARAFIAKKTDSQFNVAKAEIETEFDEVTAELTAYAKAVEFPEVPPSGSWGEALIVFLRNRSDRTGPAISMIKGALIDPYKAQSAVVGAFIKNLFTVKPLLFTKLLRIFMGVLVEEFIAAVAELGTSPAQSTNVVALYDTAVLLRLLGTSGKLLRTATDELNRYLQDLGFEIHYFAGNESEVAGIFDTLIFKKDTGKELEGETAAAISDGEVTIADLRMLQNSFTERLAGMNVFPAEALEKSVQENARYQIDEKGFAAFLLQEANVQGRAYGPQNREHDAGYLATVMRLRRGNRTRDLLSCGFVFVTTNRFLAYAARRYLIQQHVLQPQHCPPILSVGQVATIAWLMKDQAIVPEKAGRELLCNCFAAVRPDAEWFKHFREGVEKIKGSLDEFGGGNGDALTLQAARRIAQEESFGSSALVRELNMAEILSRAADEQEQALARQEAKTLEILEATSRATDLRVNEAEARRLRDLEDAESRRLAELQQMEMRRRQEAADLAAERDQAVLLASQAAAAQREAEIRGSLRANAERQAGRLILAVKLAAALAFAIVTGLAIYLQLKSETSPALWASSVILGVISVFSFMDLLKVRFVEPVFDALRSWLTERLDFR
jgi:hypothetical protein